MSSDEHDSRVQQRLQQFAETHEENVGLMAGVCLLLALGFGSISYEAVVSLQGEWVARTWFGKMLLLVESVLRAVLASAGFILAAVFAVGFAVIFGIANLEIWLAPVLRKLVYKDA